MRILALLVCGLLFSPAAFAKHINVLRNFPLSPVGDHYGISLYFEEARPGVVSQNIFADGCGFTLRSSGNYLLTARYKISLEEETAPSMGDHRWWKQYTHFAPDSDMRVTCKSQQRIDETYVRRVMAGYVRVEK